MKRLTAVLAMLALLPAIVLADEDAVTARLEALEQRVAILEAQFGSSEAGVGWEVISELPDTAWEQPGRFLGSSNISYGEFLRGSRKVLAQGTGQIWGRITTNGGPCPGLRLRFFLSNDLHTTWATSDESGIYRFQVPPGKYRFSGFEFDGGAANRLLANMIEREEEHFNDLILDAAPEPPAHGPDFEFVDAVITLYPPENGVATSGHFAWQSCSNASYYRLRLVHTGFRPYGRWDDLFPGMEKPRVDSTSTTSEELGIVLEPGHYYRWAVTAYDSQDRIISHSPMIRFKMKQADGVFDPSNVIENEVFLPEEIITDAPPLYDSTLPVPDWIGRLDQIRSPHELEVMAGKPPRPPRYWRPGQSRLSFPTEPWDPGRTETQGQLIVPRTSMPAVVLGDKIYVLGGHGPDTTLGCYRGDVELIDGEQHVTRFESKLLRRRFHTAETFGGRIFIFGGMTLGREYPMVYFPVEVEIYDPATGAFASGAPMPTPRYLAASVLLEDKIYIIGGSPPVYSSCDTSGSSCRSTSNSPPDSRCFIYHIASDTWTEAAPMNFPRQCDAVVWQGKIYAIGGYDGLRSLSCFEVYDPAANRWERLPDLPFSMSANRMVVAGDLLFSFGDHDDMTRVCSYDFRRSEWKRLDVALKPVRHAACVLMGDTIYVIGGNAGQGRADFDGGAGANPLDSIQAFSLAELTRMARENEAR